MLNYSGSLRYDMHGRKRKTKALSKPKVRRGCSSIGRAPALHAGGSEFESRQLHQKKYRSMPIGSYDAQSALLEMKKKLVAQKESAKYTVAPAYNKGAYQVIPRDCVEDIGR